MAGITNDNSKGGLFGGSTGSSAGTVASPNTPPDGTGAVALGDNERGGLFAGGDSTGHHDLQRDINTGFEELEELLAAARAARDAAIAARDEAIAAETDAEAAEAAAEAAEAEAEAAQAAAEAVEARLESLTVVATPEDPEPGENIEVQFQFSDGTDFGDSFTVPGGADGNFIVSEAAPANPMDGDAWLDCDTGVQYIYYGGAWAQPAHPASVTGAAGSLNNVHLRKSTVTATVVASKTTYTPTDFGTTSIPDNHLLIYNGLTLIEGTGGDYAYSGGNIVLTADARDALAPDDKLMLIIFRLEIETS